MSTATAARPTNDLSSHWYGRDGQPQHFVPKKSGDGMRPTTIADARKNDWLPSVTTILKVLDKPALTNWKIEQAVLAVMTTPRNLVHDGPLTRTETTDDFIKRVLHTDREQDAEAKKAADLGSRIHKAIEQELGGLNWDAELKPYVYPTIEKLRPFGQTVASEKVVVNEDYGYAGLLDLQTETRDCIWVIDFKSTKNLPKESWPEHQMQLAAYAHALGNTGDKPIRTANIYISTTEPGQVKVCENPDWTDTFSGGFKHALYLWQWLNDWRKK